MTGTSNQIRAILLVAIMLLSGVAVGTGLTGSVAAQQAQPAADSTEAPEYNLEFNGGDIYAFGSPGPTDQTLTDVFDEDLEGFNGSIYAFDSTDGSWTAVSGSDTVEVDALEAYVLTLDDGESASATIQFAQTEPAQTRQLGLSEGFNFITPTQATGVDTDAFRVTQDAFTVQNPFAEPSVSPGDEQEFAVAEIGQDSYQVNPFAGYFVSASGGLALSDVNTGMTQGEANDALGVADVTIDQAQTDSEVAQGQEFTVVVDVENTGELKGTQDITLGFADNQVDTEQVTVSGGDTEQVSLTHTVSVDTELDDYNVSVSSEQQTGETSIAVVSPEPAEIIVDDPVDTIVGNNATFEITVNDENGNPVADQFVTVANGLDGLETAPPSYTFKTATNDTGVASLNLTTEDPGVYEPKFAVLQYEEINDTASVTFETGDADSLIVSDRNPADEERFVGEDIEYEINVTDEFGNPVSDFVVNTNITNTSDGLNEDDLSIAESNTTTADGLTEFTVTSTAAGDAEITFESPDGELNATVDPSFDAEEGYIIGEVITTKDLNATFGNTDVLSIDLVAENGETFTTTLATDGSQEGFGYSFEDVPFDTYNVTASVNETDIGSPDDYEVVLNSDSDAVTVDDTGDAYGPKFTVQFTTGTLNGTLTASDGTEIQGASVTINDSETGDEVASLSTDENGTYSTELRTGSYNVTVDADGYTAETNELNDVTADSVTTVDFSLTEITTGSFSGTVTNGEGTGLDTVSVTFTDANGDVFTETVQTNNDGTYTVENVEAGDYTITASANGYEDDTTASAVTITATEDTANTDFSLTAS